MEIAFYDKKTGQLSLKAKRPALVVDVDDNVAMLRTLTSQIDKFPPTRFSVGVEKNETNGLKKDSAIMCTQDNTFNMPVEELKKLEKYGTVTTRQLLETIQMSNACNRNGIQLRKSVQLGRQQGL
ncbi:type II toxin-antitoxin system PemK/MazF family toxin [Halobacillus litoralis]|uniref:type II toxin-antitoxin system PemK/MazF family toxin n=1 Tax=Halobacillus litoralis TaxID=45668 RepID=UPI00136C5837|nr:hypothetical protein [Halobacillus litoralis]